MRQGKAWQMVSTGVRLSPTPKSATASDKINQFGVVWSWFLLQMVKISVAFPASAKEVMNHAAIDHHIISITAIRAMKSDNVLQIENAVSSQTKVAQLSKASFTTDNGSYGNRTQSDGWATHSMRTFENTIPDSLKWTKFKQWRGLLLRKSTQRR